MVKPMTDAVPDDPKVRGPGRIRINPARQASLREHNLTVVLREITHGPVAPSRADISQSTGLTRTTVSALADQLIGAGLAAELPIVHSRKAGRPAAPLVPAPDTLAAVGLEINVDYLGVRVLDLAGNTLAETVRPGDHRQADVGRTLKALAELFGDATAPLIARAVPIAGVCVALPGLVDTGSGPLRLAPNLHWRNQDILGRLTALPPMSEHSVTVANEAALAAYAESNALRQSDVHSFFYVSGEIGIGGAIVGGGHISPGSHGWSGEIGHTLVDPAGPACGCGATGCLEQYAGKDALLRAAGLDLTLGLDALIEAASSGEPKALESLRQAGSALGVALANTINLIDVDTVVLGGSYAPLTDFLWPAISEQLVTRVLSHPWAPVRVQPALAADHAALTGAALTVLDTVLTEPSRWIYRQS